MAFQQRIPHCHEIQPVETGQEITPSQHVYQDEQGDPHAGSCITPCAATLSRAVRAFVEIDGGLMDTIDVQILGAVRCPSAQGYFRPIMACSGDLVCRHDQQDDLQHVRVNCGEGKSVVHTSAAQYTLAQGITQQNTGRKSPVHASAAQYTLAQGTPQQYTGRDRAGQLEVQYSTV